MRGVGKLKTQEETKDLSMPLGIILEQRTSRNKWVEFDWSVVAVIPGADLINNPIVLRSGTDKEGDWVQYHAATLTLEIFNKETEGYKFNLGLDHPSVYVVLRENDSEPDSENNEGLDIIPFLVTVCPYEAQDYLDSGEEIVEGVLMPASVFSWLSAYVDKYYIEETFKKRKRKAFDPRKEGYDKPIAPIGNTYFRTGQ